MPIGHRHGEPNDFDARARTWDDPSKVERALRVADAIAAQVPGLAGKTVLEYGAGTGLLGLALQPRVAQVTLADSSREMLAVATEKIAARGLRNAATLPLDLATEAVPPDRFDLVCTLLTLHHIRDTDRILGAFHALLREGGVLCVADLDREDGSFHGPGAVAHEGFERGELRARLERCGFGDVRFDTVAQVRKQTAAGERDFPVFLAVARRA